MTDSYTLLDAIREERDLLEEMEKTYREQEKRLLAADCRDNARMLGRILNRFEKGYEYYMGMKEGKPQLYYNQGTRHLEREYPAVAKAKQNFNTVVTLTQGNDND
jgi:hypothetical protein